VKISYKYCHVVFLLLAAALILNPVRVRGQNAAEVPRKSPETQDQNTENGKRVFIKDGCYDCHDLEGQGSAEGPRLGPNPIPLKAFVSYVRTPTGQMPPYTSKVVSDQELAEIYAFLQTRPHPPAANAIPLLN
jgi:mono/diheme cytochrome c family protein